ncbi:CidA/LrgA family protein [Alteromonas sp. a30]|uniref:CidA/LrgA family protein n=1 Tax=Alteromonas sp. a30 TaxID=2730917 RepID=UPI00228081BE|nr:CidA/LrgA family protein [Alteromonas sp. a30]MCY7294580.1 CidA/LrgA family protein [Alteromonas sp. a30]
MLKGIFFIFLFQLIGEVVQKLLQLTFPGPVIGLILLVIFLLVTDNTPLKLISKPFENEVVRTAEGILSYLSLLFVPIGVGVVIHISLIEDQLLQVLVLLFVGTLATIGVTAWVMQLIQKRKQGAAHDNE